MTQYSTDDSSRDAHPFAIEWYQRLEGYHPPLGTEANKDSDSHPKLERQSSIGRSPFVRNARWRIMPDASNSLLFRDPRNQSISCGPCPPSSRRTIP